MIKTVRNFGVVLAGVLQALCMVQPAFGQAIAFPGAEGYGRFTTGGRGTLPDGRTIFLKAKVVEVTNLEDSGAGSFRWALTQQDTTVNGVKMFIPTTIVFRVGGVIHLKSDIHRTTKHLTIAGQTAPGDGICFRGYTVNLSGSSNLIVRHLRFRPGDESGTEVSSFRIENGSDFIIDHCSMSWSIEENTHFSSNDNTTVQWCMVTESLFNSIHKKGERGYAAQWGGEFASYHHNFLAHHKSRMPRINGSNANDVFALVDYRNNVHFNGDGKGGMYGGEFEGTPNCTGYSHINMVNNYIIPGPASQGSIFASPSTNRGGVPLCGYAKWYVKGNVLVGHQNLTSDNWLGIDFGKKDSIYSPVEHLKSDGALEAYSRYTQTAYDASLAVLADAGATLPKRDAHDTRIVAEAKGELPVTRYSYTTPDGQVTPKKGSNNGIIDTQVNLVSPEDRAAGKDAWSVYKTSGTDEAQPDTDRDGMPDAWEIAHGLNPNDYSDFRIIGPSGYTNLEIYLAELTGVKVSANKALSVNMKIYPNPSANSINITGEDVLGEITLSDCTGKLLIRKIVNENKTRLDISNYKVGLYLLQVKSKEGITLTKKVIKK